MTDRTDPLLKYLKGHRRNYFQWGEKFGLNISEQIKEVGPAPARSPAVGRIVLNDILKTKKGQRRSLGSCWRVSVKRVGDAWKSAYGRDLLANRTTEEKEVFEAIAGSRWGEMPEAWKKVPVQLRKRGVPGALAYLKVAKVIEGPAVWRDVDPGAPLQLWPPAHYPGHAPIMCRYVRDEYGKVVAMVLADQWVDFILLRRADQTAGIYGASFLRR